MKLDVTIKNGYALFWSGVFSNWYPSWIHKDGKGFPTSEHLFMYGKAMLFGDTEMAEKIIRVATPRDAKALGRKVHNFDADVWDENKFDIMYNAVLEKFRQNDDLREELLNSKYDGLCFVEASPYDRIWGIGYGVNEAFEEPNVHRWGQNLLGEVLNRVRFELKKSENDHITNTKEKTV